MAFAHLRSHYCCECLTPILAMTKCKSSTVRGMMEDDKSKQPEPPQPQHTHEKLSCLQRPRNGRSSKRKKPQRSSLRRSLPTKEGRQRMRLALLGLLFLMVWLLSPGSRPEPNQLPRPRPVEAAARRITARTSAP